jgi:protein subunit release factor A
MFKLELHPAEGGTDSELFAHDLASAVAKYSGMTISKSGRVVSLVAEHRL